MGKFVEQIIFFVLFFVVNIFENEQIRKDAQNFKKCILFYFPGIFLCMKIIWVFSYKKKRGS